MMLSVNPFSYAWFKLWWWIAFVASAVGGAICAVEMKSDSLRRRVRKSANKRSN